VQRHIDAGDISGAVVAVERKGKTVYVGAIGMMDVESKKPEAADTIFRIFSMSKPITSVAVLTMIEEGRLRLSDKVSIFIPEFKSMMVAVPKAGAAGEAAAAGAGRGGRGGRGAQPEYDLVPANREITIHDLMTHTSGVGSGGGGRGAPRSPEDNLAAYMPKLAGSPISFQPGTRWAYSGAAGPDLLGRIVEIVSGQTYDVFLRTRIFEPLGMKDTSFYASPDDPRLHTSYQSSGGKLTKGTNQSAGSGKVYFAGASGLVSTAEDYLRFAAMLANGGTLNGHRILAPRTVVLMGSNHVGDLFNQGRPASNGGEPVHGQGFGLLVETVEEPVIADRNLGAGAFGWDGAQGTRLWVDPKENLAFVIMVQTTYGASVLLHRDVESAIAQAIIK
jgi:CubicO group peptidase (beta-lactamase class C family)